MPGRVWTKEKLVAEIQKLHREGVDLSPTAMQRTHSALFASARSSSHFGSWRAAIEASGLEYDGFKRVKQQWTRDEILSRIREMNAQGHDLLDPRFKIKHRSLYLAACAHRYFGSWKRAVEAAGLDHEQMREGRVWTQARILRTIQELAAQGKPLGWAYIEEHEPGIYRAARRKENFGSWAAALQAAGVGSSSSPSSSSQKPIGEPLQNQPVMMMAGEERALATEPTLDGESARVKV